MIAVEETRDHQLLARNYRLHWLELGIEDEQVCPDWEAEALRFMEARRAEGAFAGFVAPIDGEPVGTACCQVTAARFPMFSLSDAAAIGYIWGVYTVPEHRGRGVAAKLVQACMNRLGGWGCDRAQLHTGPRSLTLYHRLGFRPTDELSATLR